MDALVNESAAELLLFWILTKFNSTKLLVYFCSSYVKGNKIREQELKTKKRVPFASIPLLLPSLLLVRGYQALVAFEGSARRLCWIPVLQSVGLEYPYAWVLHWILTCYTKRLERASAMPSGVHAHHSFSSIRNNRLFSQKDSISSFSRFRNC